MPCFDPTIIEEYATLTIPAHRIVADPIVS